MTETQKRIQAYKKALPGMKERVSAVAMLLIVSISMMTSATFAWVTLSRNPEISSIATTVTTNGNLEIALSGKKGLEPADTTVVDGGQDVTRSNLTWGNLINLSDESYKLSDISLRPASLNINKLETSPVYATQYSLDGRVEGFITDFAFTSYNPTAKKYTVPKETEYGVRGVSSVTYEQITANLFLDNQLGTIYQTYAQACTDFKLLYNNEEYMTVVFAIVQEYANVTLGNAPTDISGHMDELMSMVDALVNIVNTLGTAYAEMANLTYYQTLQDASKYEPYGLQDVIDNTIPAEYTEHLKYYSYYRTMYANLERAYDNLSAAAAKAEQNQTVYWSDIATGANLLCDMKNATVQGHTVQEIRDNLMGMVSEILGWKIVSAVINGGILKDVDQYLACDFFVDNDGTNDNYSIKVVVEKAGIEVERQLYPTVCTSALYTSSHAMEDYNATETAASGGTNQKGEATAAETYAMAIDFWVRTNEENALLILEGEFITEEQPVFVVVDNNGTTAELYLYEYTDSEYTTQTLQVYKVTENGTDTWYTVETKQPLTEVVENVEITESNPKLQTQEVIVGYEGVNRVWDELDDENNAAVMLPTGTISTTQGSGSCYVFYPETPEDMVQGLHLLSAMRIAFVEGKSLLGQAYMDVDYSYFESGRVTVPLRLYGNKAIEINGKVETNYITRLTQNEAKRITALIYLEGTGLDNSDVLSAGSITGQMNIQFGTNVMELDPMDLPDMKDDSYKIACVAPITTSETPLVLENEPWEMELTMLIEGLKPSSVKGNFISVINATQGARQDTFSMFRNAESGLWEAYTYVEGTDGAEGTWEKGISFTAPGNYQLHSLQIDGVDYALSAENVVYVKVPGMKISSLTWDDGNAGSHLTVLTAESYVDRTLSLSLGSADVHSVQGIFLGDNGKNVTVNFTSIGGMDYSGKATFTSSGTYEMTYLYVDGVITALDSTQYKTMDVSLGLTADIKLGNPYFADDSHLPEEERLTQAEKDRILDPSSLTFTPGVGYSFVYTGEETLYFDITCTVSDDQGDPVPIEVLGEKVVLNYGKGTTQNALSAILDWTGKAYTGKFENSHAKFGIFQFNHLIVRDVNFITKGTAHSITSIPAASMEYVGNDLPEDGLVFDLGMDGKPTVSLKLANASAATVELTVNSPGYDDGKDLVLTSEATVTETVVINGKETEVSTFTFTLPNDGEWTITGVKTSMVFYNDIFYDGSDAEGATGWLDMMGGETPIIPAEELPATKFVTEVIVTAPSDEIYLGNGDIGTTFSLSADQKITLSFKAYDGITDIWTYAARAGKTVTITTKDESYAWSAKSGPNSVLVTEPSPNPSVTVEASEVTLKEDAPSLTLNVRDFTVDGIYSLLNELEVTITVSDGEQSYELTEGVSLPNIRVEWNAPTVTVTAVSPAPGTTFSTTQTSGGAVVEVAGVSNYISAAKDHATVYMKGTKNTWGNWSYSVPSVTLKLEGVAAGDATLTMVNAADPSVTHVFSFPYGTTEVTQQIGKTVGATGGHDTKYLAGTTTFAEIPITYNGAVYTLRLSHPVVIEQPEAPYVLSFGNVPMDVPEDERPVSVTANGSEVTVYLPLLEWTETTAADPVYSGWSAWGKNRDIRTDYATYSQKIIFSTLTRYNYYIWSEYTRTRSVTGSTTGQDMRVTTWTINGITYAAGNTYTITLSGDAVATANISTVGQPYSMGNTTTMETEYAYGYVAGKTGQENTPSGGHNIGTASGLSAAPAPKLYSDGYTYTDINGYEAAWP